MADVPNLSSDLPPDVLRRVVVRPILAEERAEWDALVAAHHYLGLRALVGKTLRYVAQADGRWLALLGWQAAALKCAARDTWIGWAPILHYRRLHLLANNARFLILPAAGRLPNLASRVLALNLRRLSQDWQRVHGHPLLLAETFVERTRFTGACYRAANWRPLGITRGFARRNGRYAAHGIPKEILVYPLHPQARALLCAPELPAPWSSAMPSVVLTTAQMEDLQERLRALPDCRRPRGQRHRLATVLCIAIAAVLAGSRGYTAIAEWAAQLTQAQLKRLRARFDPRTERFVPPSEPTLRRVLQSIDVAAVDAATSAWLLGLADPADTLAVDGKTLRGAVRSDGRRVHLLGAFLHDLGATVAQREIPAKTNEIPEIKPLLGPLALTGRVVTADALHTQRETARFLVEDKGAHYLFVVKKNQPTLYADLSALDEAAFPQCVETLEKGHGRIERRRLCVTTALNTYVDFPYVAQVCRIEREVTELTSGKHRHEVVFVITSLPPAQCDAPRLLALSRAHWGIENRSHYVRDVTFDEDRSRIRTGNGPAMMATLRNFAISLLRLLGFSNIASGLRAFARAPHRALAAIGL